MSEDFEPKNLYEILVPCQWNSGEPIRTRHHRVWDERVRRISGGLTILRPGKGQWVHDGHLYEDRVIPVRVLCTQAQIHKIAEITIEHYEQEAVMYYQLSDWCVVTHCSEAQRAKFTHKRNTVASDAFSAPTD